MAASSGDPELSAGGGQDHENKTRVASSLLSYFVDNLAFRSVWHELNGAMGDLGTYIPIVLAVSLARGVDLGTTLIFSGVYNIVTGAIYGVPMPVQPMKAIAAAAISDPTFGVPEIMAAGILTSGFVFFLGITRLMTLVYWLVPLPVVRGIQLSQGLTFAMTAVTYIRYDQNLAKGSSLGQRFWLGLDGIVLDIIALCFIAFINGAVDERGRRPVRSHSSWKSALIAVPSAVLVFVLGVVLAVVRDPSSVKGLRAGPSQISVVQISAEAWKKGFLNGAVAQVPLSVLNSVIAVCKLTKDLFPEKEASATSVSLTMGAMNLVGCWFGAMPCCHGAGGLAGQYRFGGRSGGCVAALGALKLVIGVVLGVSVVQLLSAFPVGLLGVLLLFAGVELAAAARDMNSREEASVMLVCAAVSLVGSTAWLGFLCGMVAYGLLWMRARLLNAGDDLQCN